MSVKLITSFLTVLTLIYVVSARPHRRNVDEQLVSEAYDYYEKMQSATSCHVPQARVIHVQDVHPSSSIVYMTDCVILHRCATDTGCCPPSMQCTPKEGHEEKVKMPIMYTKPEEPMDVMMLEFTNHTECGCMSQKELANRA